MSEYNTIYVDVESLLDLRQALLIKEVGRSKALDDYLTSDDYIFRKTDNLEGYPVNYHKEMENPSVELLKDSTITYIITVLMSKVKNNQYRNQLDGTASIAKVFLNMYPFRIDSRLRDELRSVLYVKLDELCEIEVGYIPDKELSPVFFNNSDIIYALIYDFTRWFNVHSKTVGTTRIDKTNLLFSPFYRREMTEEEEETVKKSGFPDILSYLRFSLSPYVSINFLPDVFYTNFAISLPVVERLMEETETQYKEAAEKFEGAMNGNSSRET